MGSIWIIWRNNKAKWFANDFIELNSLDWIKCHNAGAGSEGFIGWSWRGLVWKTSWNPFRHVGGSRIVSHSSQLNLLLGSYNHAAAIDVFIKTQKRCETNHLLISKFLLHFIKTVLFCCIFQRFCLKSLPVFRLHKCLSCEDFFGIGILMQNCKNSWHLHVVAIYTPENSHSCLERDFLFKHGDSWCESHFSG